jgi:excisionase family DNA binding protein
MGRVTPPIQGWSMSRFFTLEEAADRLGVEYKTIYRLVRSGDIPAGKVGRIYRIREDDLDGYFERQKQLLAERTKRTGPTALEGRRCGACNSPILSELSVAGRCEECQRDICQACWAVRKVRRCAAHAKLRDAASEAEAEAGGVAEEPAAKREPGAKHEPDDAAAVVQRLRDRGLPVVTREQAKLLEEGFIRAFAQRLETIEELPDVLSGRVIRLRNARVKHAMQAGGRGPVDAPTNAISRFVLRVGGWGKPKAGLVLEARFLSRLEALASNGYDAEPLGEAELTPLLRDLRDRAEKDACFHVVLIASPTGWSDAAKTMITHRERGRAFHDRRAGVVLYDLHAEMEHLDEKDERLWPFWPVVAPARYAREVARCVETVRDLARQMEGVSLDYAAKSCGGDVSWVREAFGELKRTGQFKVDELPELGLVLSRR